MDPTVVLGGRANYGERVDKMNPQFSLLATDRWDTGIGEIGALINGTYSKSDYYRASTVLLQRRSTNTGPLNPPGYVIPGIPQNFPQQRSIDRHQVNGALEWQDTPSTALYATGFHTSFLNVGSPNDPKHQPINNR